MINALISPPHPSPTGLGIFADRTYGLFVVIGTVIPSCGLLILLS